MMFRLYSSEIRVNMKSNLIFYMCDVSFSLSYNVEKNQNIYSDSFSSV